MLLEDAGLLAELGDGRFPGAALGGGHFERFLGRGQRREEQQRRAGCDAAAQMS
jgi:hypothetical protein